MEAGANSISTPTQGTRRHISEVHQCSIYGRHNFSLMQSQKSFRDTPLSAYGSGSNNQSNVMLIYTVIKWLK
jgi:hypothetical protein